MQIESTLERIVMPDWIAECVFIKHLSLSLRNLNSRYTPVSKLVQKIGYTGKVPQFYISYLNDLKKYGLVETRGNEENAMVRITPAGKDFVSHMPAAEYVEPFKTNFKVNFNFGQVALLLDVFAGISKEEELSHCLNGIHFNAMSSYFFALTKKGLLKQFSHYGNLHSKGSIPKIISENGNRVAGGLFEPLDYLARKFGGEVYGSGQLRVFSLGSKKKAKSRRKSEISDDVVAIKTKAKQDSDLCMPKKINGGNIPSSRWDDDSRYADRSYVACLLEKIRKAKGVKELEDYSRFVLVKSKGGAPLDKAGEITYCFGERVSQGRAVMSLQITRQYSETGIENRLDYVFRTMGNEEVMSLVKMNPSYSVVPIGREEYGQLFSILSKEPKKNSGTTKVRRYRCDIEKLR